ncbi:uncharacterized protein LOC129752086 [Uranotaenia lowii]|uniref:uncharacterized protein LOC129752086 n=1 Tax=Uranotaenia lowii TaxID=190385 RepID=UPI0024789E9F|nr:uncharacterized protein LOC129752086 [Uranotaenia lowii]
MPDQDAPDYWWKMATFSYGNAAPEWNTINSEGGNWHSLERIVHRMALDTKKRYEIFTGVLPGNPPKYLVPGGRISIPKWFWKVIKYESQGIVVFVLNDPKPAAKDAGKKFCSSDKCALLGWEFSGNKSKGLAHCCSYEGDVRTVLPKQAAFSKLLSVSSPAKVKTRGKRPRA